MLMRLVNCESVTFTDLTFRNPASWGIHLVECRQVRFDGVEIQSRDNNSNNDGIDLDGCSDVTIENCRINSGDDAICPKSTTLKPCENIIVRNCVISSHTAGFKLGTSSRGGFLNIKVTDTIGVVPFLEAGTVTDSSVPGFGDRLFVGAGIGLRYHTGFGPVRLDVGTPLNRRKGVDDLVQVYISLGQAF